MNTENHDESPQKPILTRRLRAIEALVAGSNKREAAAAAGVSDETIRRWMQDPDFVAAIRAAKSEALDEVGRNLLRIGSKAVTTLETIMDDPNSSASVRQRAANDSLSQLFKMWETMTVEERLKAIEDRLATIDRMNANG